MKGKEIIEGNRLIAEFMRWESNRYDNLPNKLHKYKGDEEESIHVGQLEYHFSFDWLFEVIKKIQDIEITPPPNYTCYRIEIVVQGYVKIEGPFPFRTIFATVSGCGSLINALWQTVVQFITWLNSQPHQQTSKKEEK
jgi:hypothetical protein